MRVDGFLRASARRFPGKTALVADGRRLSYRELAAEADCVAASLARRGFARGDRAVVFLDNSPEAVAAVFGIAAAGGVFSVVNPGTKADKLAFILENSGARAVFTEPRLAPVFDAARARARCEPILTVAAESWRATLGTEGVPPAAPGIDLDLAMIVYTSGSTGAPKGVMMTHQNVDAAAGAITAYLESSPEDVVLSVLPLAFDYGLYQALMCAKVGATLVLEKSFAYPALMLEKLAAENVTGLPLVPTVAALLVGRKDIEPGRFPRLRYITNTAAALPPAHVRRLQELFPATRLYSMYGVTECKRCTWLPPEELARRPDSVGIPIPGTEAWVVDEQGERAPPGVVGELVVRGPHVMKGYWKDEAATREALRPGPYPWEPVLHTGDLFRADEDGFLYFVARKDDIIKSRGEKVSPKEVENVLYAIDGVREAAVVGVPDPVLGMAIKAIVAVDPRAGLTERDIVRHCARHLEDFMVPRLVEFREALPKSANGKIRRSAAALEA